MPGADHRPNGRHMSIKNVFFPAHIPSKLQPTGFTGIKRKASFKSILLSNVPWCSEITNMWVSVYSH